MPFNTTKPIVLICGSRSISEINFSRFINPEHVGAIVSGGAKGVDTCAERWAKINHIEFICMEPNYEIFGDRACFIRDEDMVNFCDVVIAFWDGKSRGTDYTVSYAKKIGRRTIVHLILE